MDGYNLVLSSSVTGSSGTISVAANTFATQFLGLQSGKVTGSGGENAVLEGGNDLSGGIKFGGAQGQLVRFRIADGDFNTSPDDMAADLTFPADSAISSVSITETFNSYFSANNITAEATITSSGKLELRSTETGEDAKISIAGIDSGVGINDQLFR